MKVKQIIILLAFIAFWFEGNTLHWTTDKESPSRDRQDDSPYFLQLQMDKKIPPTINQEPISQISVGKKVVRIFAGDTYFWDLYYTNDVEGRDWYVKGPYGPDGKL